MFWINFEQLFSIVIVYSIIIGQLEIRINWISSSSMNVMNSSLWHSIQYFEQIATLHHLLVLEEIMDGPVKLSVVGNLFSHYFEKTIGLSLCICKASLEPIAEMLFGF